MYVTLENVRVFALYMILMGREESGEGPPHGPRAGPAKRSRCWCPSGPGPCCSESPSVSDTSRNPRRSRRLHQQQSRAKATRVFAIVPLSPRSYQLRTSKKNRCRCLRRSSGLCTCAGLPRRPTPRQSRRRSRSKEAAGWTSLGWAARWGWTPPASASTATSSAAAPATSPRRSPGARCSPSSPRAGCPRAPTPPRPSPFAAGPRLRPHAQVRLSYILAGSCRVAMFLRKPQLLN